MGYFCKISFSRKSVVILVKGVIIYEKGEYYANIQLFKIQRIQMGC